MCALRQYASSASLLQLRFPSPRAAVPSIFHLPPFLLLLLFVGFLPIPHNINAPPTFCSSSSSSLLFSIFAPAPFSTSSRPHARPSTTTTTLIGWKSVCKGGDAPPLPKQWKWREEMDELLLVLGINGGGGGMIEQIDLLIKQQLSLSLNHKQENTNLKFY